MNIHLFFSAIIFAGSIANAYAENVSPSSITIKGGSNASVVWRAPATQAYKVSVFVPNTASATKALYRVYPNGKAAGSTTCLSTDASYPCYEIAVNQAFHKGQWVLLTTPYDSSTANNGFDTNWNFTKNKGYVTVNSSNLSSSDILSAASVRFDSWPVYYSDYLTMMRDKWAYAIAATDKVKMAINQCLIDFGSTYYCDSTANLYRGKYGVSSLPVLKSGSVVLIFATAAIQITGNAPPGSCSFQLKPIATLDSATAKLNIAWEIKATAFTAPATSTTFCTNFVPGSTAL